MKVLVTGGCGFLGESVANLLKSNHEVITADIQGNPDLLIDLSLPESIKLLPDVDVVVNCAAVQYVTKKKPLFFWRKWFYRNNVTCTSNLIARYEDTNTFFIHVATSMMYKQNYSAFYTTTSQLGCQGVYSGSKLICQKLVRSSKLKSATVIPCIIGGKGREGLFVNFVRSIKNKGFIILPGSGVYKANMVHVEDVASLIALLTTTKKEGVYNAAASDPLSLNEWVDITSSVLNKKVKVIHLPLAPIAFISKLFFYRILAREQLLMLGQDHILDVSESLKLGWNRKYTNKELLVDLIIEIDRNA